MRHCSRFVLHRAGVDPPSDIDRQPMATVTVPSRRVARRPSTSQVHLVPPSLEYGARDRDRCLAEFHEAARWVRHPDHGAEVGPRVVWANSVRPDCAMARGEVADVTYRCSSLNRLNAARASATRGWSSWSACFQRSMKRL